MCSSYGPPDLALPTPRRPRACQFPATRLTPRVPRPASPSITRQLRFMAPRWPRGRWAYIRSPFRFRSRSPTAIGPSKLLSAELSLRLELFSRCIIRAETEQLMKTVLKFSFLGLAVLSVCYAQAVINTVAGNGTLVFSGDGAPATKAGVGIPPDMAVDGAGNLYIVDRNNNRIRKVDTSGTISTFAGNGTSDFSGDGGPATSAALFLPIAVAVDGAGNVYIADGGSNGLRKVNTAGIIS